MRALILEDNIALAQSLRDMLEEQGWSTHCAASLRSASRLTNKAFFDLFVLDMLLPDKKGWELLSLLPPNKISPSAKIILISGFMTESSALKNIPPRWKARCVFFKKPLDEKMLYKFLQTAKPLSGDKKEAVFFEKSRPSKPLDFYLPPNTTFDSKDLIFSVFLAHLKKFTGELKITANNTLETLIQFRQGHITKAVSNSGDSFFGAILVEHGLSIQKDIEALLKDKESKLIGERLVERELLSPYMLDFMLKEQIKIRLSEIMSGPSFKLRIVEKALKSPSSSDVDFTEADFIDWLADSAQTELTEEFIKKFCLEIKFSLIQKSSPPHYKGMSQKRFLRKYGRWLLSLSNGSAVQEALENSKNRHETGLFLYFGLLSKSLYLKEQREEPMDIRKINLLLDSIIEKDPEDLFALLDLPWGASPAEANKSYKRLIQKTHLDLLPPHADDRLKEKAKQVFYKLQKSYEALKDGKKRAEYMKSRQEEAFITVMGKYEEGLAKIKRESYAEGLAILRQIVNHKSAPGNTRLYILWAQLKDSCGDLTKNQKKAIDMQKAIESCPISLRTSPLFWYVKGLFYAQTKQYEKACDLFNKSLSVQGAFPEAKRELFLIKHKLKTLKLRQKKNIFNFFLKKSG